MKKIGVFGGAFDPIHIGHINLVNAVIKELKLSELIVIPSSQAPHKSEKVSFTDRFEMCRLAFEDRNDVYISDIERKTGGKSYTINTIRALREIYPEDTELWLIIGSDQLFLFDKWYRHEAILKECHVAAAAREEDSYADMLEKANELGHIRVMNLPITRISSTEIRAKLEKKEDTEGFVDEKVLAYIKERGLYGA